MPHTLPPLPAWAGPFGCILSGRPPAPPCLLLCVRRAALRQAIAKAVVSFYQKYVDEQSKQQIKDALLQFDRTLLVADPRRCEPKKWVVVCVCVGGGCRRGGGPNACMCAARCCILFIIHVHAARRQRLGREMGSDVDVVASQLPAWGADRTACTPFS